VKGADLGEQDGRLVLDFNFAYEPSCAYDPALDLSAHSTGQPTCRAGTRGRASRRGLTAPTWRATGRLKVAVAVAGAAVIVTVAVAGVRSLRDSGRARAAGAGAG